MAEERTREEMLSEMAEEKKWWCEHIKRINHSFDTGFVRGGRLWWYDDGATYWSAPKTGHSPPWRWGFCPICGAKRLKEKK